MGKFRKLLPRFLLVGIVVALAVLLPGGTQGQPAEQESATAQCMSAEAVSKKVSTVGQFPCFYIVVADKQGHIRFFGNTTLVDREDRLFVTIAHLTERVTEGEWLAEIRVGDGWYPAEVRSTWIRRTEEITEEVDLAIVRLQIPAKELPEAAKLTKTLQPEQDVRVVGYLLDQKKRNGKFEAPVIFKYSAPAVASISTKGMYVLDQPTPVGAGKEFREGLSGAAVLVGDEDKLGALMYAIDMNDGHSGESRAVAVPAHEIESLLKIVRGTLR